MLVTVIAIGNSKGIRIPKSVIDQLHISDKLEMAVENQQLVLTPVKEKPRSGWEKAFQEMHEAQDDQLILTDSPENEAFEWEW